MLITFEELVEKAKNDLDITSDNLVEVSARTGVDLLFYAEARKNWSDHRDVLKQQLDKISRFLWLYYTGKGNADTLAKIGRKPFKIQLATKQDIDKFIISDDMYIDNEKQITAAENVIKFLDEVIGAVKFRAQVVRNIIQEKTSLGA